MDNEKVGKVQTIINGTVETEIDCSVVTEIFIDNKL
jgi:molybdopterin-binding protein